MVRNSLRVVAVAVLAGILAACVGSAAGQLMPRTALDQGKTFFVEKHEKDTRNLAESIAQTMRARGLSATSGAAADRSQGVDYVVTYTDRWMWDMRMYLADLRIEVRDARDNSLMGYGQSSQSSLKAMGQSHEDIIVTALNELLGV